MNFVQGSPEWLSYLRSKLGASDAPIVMQVIPWRTPLQLWQEKLGIGPPQKETAAMRYGTETEEFARQAYIAHTGIEVKPEVVLHPDQDFMMASLDGLNREFKTAVEIKCPGKEDHFLAVTKKIPAKYFPQCQHQLMVTGLRSMFYYSFDGEVGVSVEVLRDEAYIADMFEKQQAFWDKINRPHIVKTEKEYKCVSCNCTIAVGSKAVLEAKLQNVSGSGWNGQFITEHKCLVCANIVKKVDL